MDERILIDISKSLERIAMALERLGNPPMMADSRGQSDIRPVKPGALSLYPIGTFDCATGAMVVPRRPPTGEAVQFALGPISTITPVNENASGETTSTV